ncbi:hypothetical protein COEREDRAFT_87522 [Coemansia reversa NRRL 1564]|uniref:Uncharacterized protein n=1 Tax=Coemansia reversa (strain ATCC 12441 / NRRL 1564) TaxID=763665 RepID=A0A2G5B9W7_COERN|nr:hypothetical protein COEREDRAFT_87522 [Coemansia reversa NRRL 1564]|eukprot:PIA15772.1 hypothetical protein COEREDRAFT_87522 [Coemansia reversa NRRL 1564]
MDASGRKRIVISFEGGRSRSTNFKTQNCNIQEAIYNDQRELENEKIKAYLFYISQNAGISGGPQKVASAKENPEIGGTNSDSILNPSQVTFSPERLARLKFLSFLKR